MSKWIVCPYPRSQPKLRLLCFTYAGGAAWTFRDWAAQLPDSVEVCAIELPGRGKRMREASVSNLNTLMNALGPEILPYLNVPFACFGHSLGGLIAFELCVWLRHHTNLTPKHVWVSAAPAPQRAHEREPISRLPDKDFIHVLQSYKGTPTGVLDNAELMAMALPILRADFALLDTYQYKPVAPFRCPITAFWGTQDETFDKDQIIDWRIHTNNFSLESVNGEHFFMRQPDFPRRLLTQISTTIESIPSALNYLSYSPISR
ncbi:MAG: alpha/beta fold hydrolase [Cyanobacteria bacterium P01_F01_bin.150]